MPSGLEFPISSYVDLPGSSEFYNVNAKRQSEHRRSHPPAFPSENLSSRLSSTRKRFSTLFHLGASHHHQSPQPGSSASSLPSRQHQPATSRASYTRPNRSREDLLATLNRYDTVFLVDDSASMSKHGRWQEAGAALSAVVTTAVRYDPDGIDIYFLNTTAHLRNIRSAREVENLFRTVQPTGPSTPIEVRVEALTSLHLNQLESNRAQGLPPIKPMNLIVITDGATDDPDTLLYTIASLANRLDEGRFPPSQLGIQFIQIGHDREATEFLNKLDSDLKHTYGVKRDIVDTSLCKGKLSEDFVMKSLLGGINRRIDGDRSRR